MNPIKENHDLNPDHSRAAWDSVLECMLSARARARRQPDRSSSVVSFPEFVGTSAFEQIKHSGLHIRWDQSIKCNNWKKKARVLRFSVGSAHSSKPSYAPDTACSACCTMCRLNWWLALRWTPLFPSVNLWPYILWQASFDCMTHPQGARRRWRCQLSADVGWNILHIATYPVLQCSSTTRDRSSPSVQ